MKFATAAPLLMLLALAVAARAEPPPLEDIVVAPDARGFVLQPSQQPFHPWGANYGNAGQLIEDFWDHDWATVEADFHKLADMGANVVRVHLQFGKFMTSPTKPNQAALKQLSRLLRLAESVRIYVDLTGLACYRKVDVPTWYDTLDEVSRWAAQAKFWEAVAVTGAGSKAIFCYDLINEPLAPGANKRESGQWYSGSTLGGYDFLQWITLDPAGRSREQVVHEWISQLTKAIRSRDPKHLITVGMLPWSRQWKHLSGFIPSKVAADVDFLSVHLYPDTKQPGEALEALQQCKAGKPVVIEETFPLSCSVEELQTFLLASRDIACGWIGHYDGKSLAELDAMKRNGSISPHDDAYRAWLRLFVDLKPKFVGGL